jgi:hypothetical protein
MSQSEDWIKIEVIVPKKYFVKNTERAMCFKLWDVKFIAFPLKFIEGLNESGTEYSFFLPKWYVKEHSLKSLVVDSQKDLFPSQREIKQRQKELAANTPPPLFISTPRTEPNHYKNLIENEEVQADEVSIRELDMDDDIPF